MGGEKKNEEEVAKKVRENTDRYFLHFHTTKKKEKNLTNKPFSETIKNK